MPFAPENRDVFGVIRPVEILYKLYAEHSGKAYCHVGISAEIEINLKCISCYSPPCIEHSRIVGAKSRVCYRCYGICQNDLFPQSKAENCRSACEFFNSMFPVSKLFGNRTVPYYRSCNKMREQSDKARKSRKIACRFCIASVQVNCIA